MKTAGVAVGEGGYLVQGFQRDGKWEPAPWIVPPPFWARLLDLATKAARGDEFKADGAKLRETLTGSEAEVAMFRLWVTKLGIELPEGHYPGTKLWPWARGWTEADVDGYLVAPIARAA